MENIKKTKEKSIAIITEYLLPITLIKPRIFLQPIQPAILLEVQQSYTPKLTKINQTIALEPKPNSLPKKLKNTNNR